MVQNKPSTSTNGQVQIGVEMPVKTSHFYAENELLAGVTYFYDVKIEIQNLLNQTLVNFSINIVLPITLEMDPSDFSPTELNVSGNTLQLNGSIINPFNTLSIHFKVRPPSSVPYKTTEILSVLVSYKINSTSEVLSYNHQFHINPPPAWVTYLTIILGLVILGVVILIAKKTSMLNKYSTIDLVNITVLASLGSIVFKWIWQVFNDFLGPFGGLLLTIPASLLMVIAIKLVKKLGTATLFFLVWELVNFFIWGSNIMSWFGWYLLEGVTVDALVILLRDYAERPITASLYGLTRCFIAYWTTYFWFSPAIWKVYYAPWYAWFQVLIGVVGGVIGGLLGYYTGRRLEKAIVAY
ncbi:MAG: hypothetical protein ACTSQI_00975 [Candidatus Helarchaeota archaeon]